MNMKMNMKMKMNNKTFCEIVLSILFVIFIVMDYRLPSCILEFKSSIWGKLGLFGIIAYLLGKCNPILAVLSLFVVFKILNQQKQSKFVSSENKKIKEMTSFNVLHKSLEEDIVSKMKPLGVNVSKSPYEPILSDNHNANSI